MSMRPGKYVQLSDNEWIELLMATPPEESAHRYFFEVKCRTFLQYIASTIFGSDDSREIIGDFYQFLSQDDWHVLRLYKKRNGASLGSYLSRCAVHHFMAIKKREQESRGISMEHPDIIKELSLFTQDEETEQPPVWEAFSKLNERDQLILRHIVIEGKSALEAADTIWAYVKSDNKDWRTLSPKRVQDTIAMLKKRALLSLSLELKKLL